MDPQGPIGGPMGPLGAPDQFFPKVPKNLPGVREIDQGTFLNTSEKKLQNHPKTPREPIWSAFPLIKHVMGTLLGPPGKSPKIVEKVVQLGPVDHLRSTVQIRGADFKSLY